MTLRQQKAASPSAAQIDQAIENLERRVLQNPDDGDAARYLLTILNLHTPVRQGLGPYTDCQLLLPCDFYEETSLEEQLNPSQMSDQYRRQQRLLNSMRVNPPVAVTQLFVGKVFTIHGTQTNCELRMKLFNEKSVISKLCHDCFKVQILPLNVVALMQVYLILRRMNLPRGNYRKCMVELREDVAYPYKGYIFCESEDEAKECLEKLRLILDRHSISKAYCGISHGCSEYGLKFPEFKFSKNGSHRSFGSPASWTQTTQRKHLKEFSYGYLL